MKIIDWKLICKDRVRFYLGKNDLKEWRGDDWNDIPYEHNAKKVYEEFIMGTIDLVLYQESLIFEPREGHLNSPYSKDDFVSRKFPCIVIIRSRDIKEFSKNGHNVFSDVLRYENAVKIYLGDYVKDVVGLIYETNINSKDNKGM